MNTETQRVACLTPIAIDALRNARDNGSVMHGFRWSASRERLINQLRKMGLLLGVEVTDAGNAALTRIEVFHG